MSEKQAYRPSEMRFWLMYHMLDEIYLENHGVPEGDDPSKYSMNEFPPYYRHNDVTGIGRCFDRDLFIRGPTENVRILESDGTEHVEVRSKFNYQATRKVLEDLVDRGILVMSASSNVRNRKLYFPDESDSGLSALVDYLGTYAEYAGGRLRVNGGRGDLQPWPYKSFTPIRKSDFNSYEPLTIEADILLSSKFCRMTVTRGLILRRLGTLGKYLIINLSVDGRQYKVCLPIRGRYLRTYEDTEPFERFLDNCNGLRDMLEGLTNPELWLDLIGGDRAEADKSSVKRMSKGIKDRIRTHLETVSDLVVEELERMKALKAAVEDADEQDARFWFGYDRHDDLRMESWGSRPVLDEDDIGEMRRAAKVLCPDGSDRRWVEAPSYPEGLVELAIQLYPEVVDDQVVIPTLCLIQMSPSALICFANSGSKWGFVGGFLDPCSGDVGRTNRMLYLAALSDQISGRCNYNLRGWDTTYVGRGEMCIMGKQVSADMVFEVNRGRYVVYHGCEMSQTHLLDNMVWNPLVIGTGNGIDADMIGDARYSDHLLRTVESVRKVRFLPGYGDPESNFQNVLLNMVMTGDWRSVFRPHGFRGEDSPE